MCGAWRQPFCTSTAGCCGGGASSCAPAEIYTTTFSSAFPGPVTTFSNDTGFEYCFAQLGSWDMSIVLGFAGVPSNLTWPLAVPFPGRADVIVMTVKTAPTATMSFLACIVPLLLSLV